MSKLSVSDLFKGVSKEWTKVFISKKLLPHLSKVLNMLNKEDISKITPSPKEIFNFARVTPYDQIKIVILGQDPYPCKGDAHGLAFSSNAKTVPASLRNIYKCLVQQKLISEIPKTSDLTYWAKQGVLLLNTSLTTLIGKTKSHMNIWKGFIDELIKHMSNDMTCGKGEALIFMLWGNIAQKKKCLIDDDCIVYNWRHPSPMAQASAPDEEKFVNCDHFSKANFTLPNDMDLKAIDWNVVPHHTIYTDGACSNNGKGIFSSAGFSVYFADGPLSDQIHYQKIKPVILKGKMKYGTNIRGEGFAILHGLEQAVKCGFPFSTEIITDSEFWIQMIEEKMPRWEGEKRDFKSMANSDITTALHQLVQNIQSSKNTSVKFTFIAAHGKDPNSNPIHVEGNDIADKYAVKAKLLKNYELQKV